MHPEPVHEAILRAAEHIRSGKGPYFLEINTYRYRGHSVSDPAKYRTKEELEHYKGIDPILQVEKTMMSNDLVTRTELDAIEEEIKAIAEHLNNTK